MVEGMSVVVNVMLYQMSVMSPPPAWICDICHIQIQVKMLRCISIEDWVHPRSVGVSLAQFTDT